MGRIVTVGVLVGVGTIGWFVFSHYSDSYVARLSPPNESWIHDSPWDYADLFGEHAGLVRDNVFFAGRDAEIAILSTTDPLLRSYPLERFVEDSRAAFAGVAADGKVFGCSALKDEVASWSCLEWQAPHDGEAIRQRVYLTGRGKSKLTVLFTAPADDFGIFGDPRRWIAGLDWRGPGIAYAF